MTSHERSPRPDRGAQRQFERRFLITFLSFVLALYAVIGYGVYVVVAAVV